MTLLRRFFAVVCLAVLFSGGAAAWAQMPSLQATLPFPFFLNGKRMPAGEYRLQSLGIESAAWRMEHDGRGAIFVPWADGESAPMGGPALRFHCFGQTCFFAGFVRAGDDRFYSVRPSAREVEMARHHDATEIVIAAQ